MRHYFLSRPSVSVLALVSIGFAFLPGTHSWSQATRNAPAAQKPPANGGLFPDPEPVLVEKATLRNLLEALTRKDEETTTSIVWQFLATMSKAHEQGVGPSEYLAAGYKAERLKGTDAAVVQNCLLSAWSGAQSMALFTPENIALMERGTAPRGTRGADRGRQVNLDLETPPTVTVTTNLSSHKAAATATPLPAKVPESVAPAFVVKTTEVKLHDKISLDAAGIRNMVFSLESVDPGNSVTFTFEDRDTHHFGYGTRLDTLNQMSRQMGSDGVNRMTTFSPQPIPDTNIRGVKLVTIPFGAIYLDENIGVGVTFRLVIRVASEALMYDRLPPDRQKLYELHNPAP